MSGKKAITGPLVIELGLHAHSVTIIFSGGGGPVAWAKLTEEFRELVGVGSDSNRPFDYRRDDYFENFTYNRDIVLGVVATASDEAIRNWAQRQLPEGVKVEPF